MAKPDDLFTTLRKRGLRKSAARAVAKAEGGGKKSGAVARDVLADLEKATAATRKRETAKRSDAAKRAARTRKARAKSR
jgi:diacylglycerol kinase family enzyme